MRISDLLQLADLYCQARGMAEATLSTRLLAGGRRLADLRAGKTDIGVKRLERAVAWFSTHWPEDLAWPEGIERPAPEPAEAA